MAEGLVWSLQAIFEITFRISDDLPGKRKVTYGIYKLFQNLPSGFPMICTENGRSYMEFISFYKIYLPNDISLRHQTETVANSLIRISAITEIGCSEDIKYPHTGVLRKMRQPTILK